jgi:hypothetical protein
VRHADEHSMAQPRCSGEHDVIHLVVPSGWILGTWIVSEVERGAKLPGLYPMNDEAKARYQVWKKK